VVTLPPSDLPPWQRRILEAVLEAVQRGDRVVILVPRGWGKATWRKMLAEALDASERA
jgi:ABC-type iron transport system FetAB ATPase subunit